MQFAEVADSRCRMCDCGGTVRCLSLSRATVSLQALVRITALATMAGFLPSMTQQIRRPSERGLLYCMANSAFAFYMFSYQVSFLMSRLSETPTSASQNNSLPLPNVGWKSACTTFELQRVEAKSSDRD